MTDTAVHLCVRGISVWRILIDHIEGAIRLCIPVSLGLKTPTFNHMNFNFTITVVRFCQTKPSCTWNVDVKGLRHGSYSRPSLVTWLLKEKPKTRNYTCKILAENFGL